MHKLCVYVLMRSRILAWNVKQKSKKERAAKEQKQQCLREEEEKKNFAKWMGEKPWKHKCLWRENVSNILTKLLLIRNCASLRNKFMKIRWILFEGVLSSCTVCDYCMCSTCSFCVLSSLLSCTSESLVRTHSM